MIKKCLLGLFVLALAFAPAAMAQADNPTIAILRFGALPSLDITEGAILDLLEAYGYLSSEENRILEERRDHQGENINIIWGDAGFDYPTVTLMVENAIDEDADALVTLGTPVTLVTVNTTLDLEEPPAVLFTAVHSPYLAGIADSACIKPAHVTGSEIETSYEFVFDALRKQNPALSVIGTIYDTAAASGVYGIERIADLAEGMGISVEVAGVTALSDLRAATAGLMQKGADAIVLPIDSLTTQGLPIIVTIANENGVPVFHPSMGSIYYGATIGAGYSGFYDNGVRVGIMLAAYLNGDIDIATTGIHVATGRGLGINLDSASLQDVEVSSELMREADVVLEGGNPTRVSARIRQKIRQRGVVIPLERRQDADREFLAAIQCSEEMIAEQQAALYAAES
ncbi:MAG: ABC transporter substrate binding protein [Chloroflexi bacterium]|nr:ABC transporter substrate binding protein [Chloroflexota bacterium]MCY3979250.1 ABC transporter substrate binding protein [Chloroflexota bacterium]